MRPTATPRRDAPPSDAQAGLQRGDAGDAESVDRILALQPAVLSGAVDVCEDCLIRMNDDALHSLERLARESITEGSRSKKKVVSNIGGDSATASPLALSTGRLSNRLSLSRPSSAHPASPGSLPKRPASAMARGGRPVFK